MKIENTTTDRINSIRVAQQEYFRSGATLDIKFRKTMLFKFRHAMHRWEKKICEALWTDLHKSYEEAFITEISIVEGEIQNHIDHIEKWTRRKRKFTPLKLFPSRSFVVTEPLGNTLVIAPWNYPVQLLLNPLVGAIAAGCTAVLKPSPYVPNVSKVIEQMIQETFDERYVAVVQGNRDVNQALLDLRWDLIFFTGSPSLGKKVMSAAARHLTPVILELGGKSPCIIDKSADIRLAARRIAWGKTLNSGQTCIAPDYILIHKDVKDEFVKAFGKEIHNLHGNDVQQSRHYVRMVNEAAFRRVSSYIEGANILFGGHTDASERFIEPTLIDAPGADSPVMTEEIFGPVFPVVTLDDCGKCFLDKVTDYVTSREKPLAFYYFGKEKDGWKAIRRTSSGGGCINDVIMHIANENIPFGGVGNSGTGHYHGKDSLLAFSHQRSVISTGTWIDLPFRYMPYKLFKLVKAIL